MTVRALNIYLSLGGQFPLLLSVPGFSSFKSENVSLVPAKSYPVPEHTHKEETSQNEHYYSCLIHEPWRDLWHGVRFKLFSLWTCQRQERQWKIHQNLLLEKKKNLGLLLHCKFTCSKVRRSEVISELFSGFGVCQHTPNQSRSPMTTAATRPKLVLPPRCVLDQIVETHTEHPFPICTSVKDSQESTRTP